MGSFPETFIYPNGHYVFNLALRLSFDRLRLPQIRVVLQTKFLVPPIGLH